MHNSGCRPGNASYSGGTEAVVVLSGALSTNMRYGHGCLKTHTLVSTGPEADCALAWWQMPTVDVRVGIGAYFPHLHEMQEWLTAPAKR